MARSPASTALPTIKKLIADGGKVILCSHLGKVKTEEDKKTKTLAPVAKRLSELPGQEVKFVPSPVVVDDSVRAAVSGMTICGKTGSAETSLGGRYVTHGWFVGYNADDAYPYALAVVVEDIGDGAGGGSTAAPIAGDIFRYLKEQTPYAN